MIRRIIQLCTLSLFLAMFFIIAWPYSAPAPGCTLADREIIPAELILWIDPLVGLSTAIAARHWNTALIGMAVILAVAVFIPRGFCGHLCPLGTLIDGFDALLALVRFPRRRAKRQGRPWYVHIKHLLLAAILVTSALGVLTAGYFAAIPILTRALAFSAGRWQAGLLKSWGLAGPLNAAMAVSLALFAVVFLLSLISRRFWCRYVCPSGAVFSWISLLRVGQRQVTSACIDCGKCARACPFDAIRPDIETRTADCTFCRTCAAACPEDAIRFTTRWKADPKRVAEAPASTGEDTGGTSSRRAVLASAAAGVAAALTVRSTSAGSKPLRPPGSVAEGRFLDLCIRCGECIKVCPGPVLRAAGLEHGLDSLWTPIAVPTQAGCHQDCHFCTQVCPTGAIRPLTLAEKRKAVMGLAAIDPALCLPHAGKRECRLCVDECDAAGYRAISLQPIQLKVDDVPPGMLSDEELEQMGTILAPKVEAAACVGCGLCEYRCHSALVKRGGEIPRPAVTIAPVAAGSY